VEILQLITEFDKRVYNTYLKVSRSSNNQPFKFRKDFEKLDEKSFVALKKVSSFLKRYPQIKLEEFFKAPLALYPDETYFPLEYFHSLKATKTYTLFNKKQLLQDPDSEEQLNGIKKSLVFIYNFCKDRNINVLNYVNHMTNNELSFIIHLKNHDISLFVLFGFPDFERRLKSRDAEVVKFILGEETYNNISFFRTKLYNSKKAGKLVELGLKKIINKA